MMKKILFVCINGWCNDDAPWLHVFASLCAAAFVFFTLTFLLCSWMFVVY